MDFKESSQITEYIISVYQKVHGYSLRRKFILGALIFVVFYFLFLRAPFGFPHEKLITIEKGATLGEVAELLEKENIILNQFFFKSFVITKGGQGGVISGDYFLDERENILEIATRFTKGRYNLTPVTVTLPEGSTIVEMTALLEEKLPQFNKEEFVTLTKDEEGYLFPDTYHFLPNETAEGVYKALREVFNVRIESIQEEFDRSEHSLKEIITMASLLEEEARTTETRRMISGILWERLRIGMALQVDAVFPYIIGKNTFEVSLDDLQFDSPYNTYKYIGLPPGPISNPGLDSILAALNPISSSYLYYLSDKEGNIYYAETFEEHKRNKARYLR